MKNLIAFILIAFILVNCQVAQPLNQAVTAAEQLAIYYDGDISSLLSTANLSAEEMKVIGNAIQTANRIRNQFESLKSNPTTVNLTLVEMEYKRLRNAYVSVRNIALAHQQDYSEDTWHTFEIFNIYASTLDTEFSNLLEATRTNEAIINTISLANSVIRIVALL